MIDQSTAQTSTPLLLNIHNTQLQVTNEQFEQLCQANPDLRLELTSQGDLIVMAPTFASSGGRNFSLIVQFGIWVEQTKLGKGFDSSTGYDFSEIGGGRPSPDVSWIENSRLVEVDLEQYLKIVPDFVVELRSSTDRLSDLQKKMREYQKCGVKLGWLINPQDKQVEIYRLNDAVEILEFPSSLSGENVLPGFMLNLTTIW
jgi:Uma2 family endonuclease